ncbi:hypothetical protein [Ureaplasma canigenitalium]|uniref:hypothetical protein n=1 Tax=Ureaplasma canigenitalium TaxID=42092 RepID=UPI0004E0B067|nr:hypothetical protein [Ureaplasma canigenitalium]
MKKTKRISNNSVHLISFFNKNREQPWFKKIRQSWFFCYLWPFKTKTKKENLILEVKKELQIFLAEETGEIIKNDQINETEECDFAYDFEHFKKIVEKEINQDEIEDMSVLVNKDSSEIDYDQFHFDLLFNKYIISPARLWYFFTLSCFVGLISFAILVGFLIKRFY